MLFDLDTIFFLKVAIEKDGYLELPAHGNSMFPLIQRGNVCRFIPCSPGSLMKGDIILFHNNQGQLIAHRFIRTESENGATLYILKGDTNLGHDLPVTAEQLIGKLAYIKKEVRGVSINDFIPVLWRRLLITLPNLSGVLRKYLNWKSHYKFLWSKLWRKLNSL